MVENEEEAKDLSGDPRHNDKQNDGLQREDPVVIGS